MYTPKYSISNKILKNIGITEAAREVIMNAPLVPAWEKKFRDEAILRTVHYGTHIEGNELNFTEAAQVLEGKEIVGRDRDIQEVINYRQVLRFIDSFTGEIAAETIKTMHKLTTEKILEAGECGQFRTKQVVVKNSQTQEVVFRPPPALEVPYQVDDFIEWLRQEKEIHPVLKAGVTHYELVRIHPFLDGNGRVARAVATLVLFKEGYDIKKFFSLEEHYDQDASRYYAALQSVKPEENYDLTDWLDYFTEGLAIELTRIKEKVQSLSIDLKLKEKIGGTQIALSERQMKIIDHIQKVGFLQNKQFAELLPMISEDTILRDLKDLLKKGIIKKEGTTKAARYILKG
ncbi:MAG: Fic family protein [Patescibacteria group bacterium]|nr:Fic family protein [Patescibacteria group bacterium]MCL5095721.1 Fic family protein [Patescibacteria group bacterium]